THALLDAKLVGLAKWLATKREMKFFEVNQVVWIFSCFLLSKIAYNQRKAKNRLMILPTN
ncbi:hypothetical protein RGC49_07680, partial [Helicobacter pylori]|nr:hypothetical protein [Helicobacter pylori]